MTAIDQKKSPDSFGRNGPKPDGLSPMGLLDHIPIAGPIEDVSILGCILELMHGKPSEGCVALAHVA